MPHHPPPLFFPALFVSAKVLQSYETDGFIIHLAVRDAPQGNPFLFGHGSPRPPLIPAPLAFYPSSFVIANSSMWALHAPAETRRVCGSIQSWFDPLLPSDPESV